MKLSDMFTSLAENARVFEARSADWQAQMAARNDEMQAQIRKWQSDAAACQDQLGAQLRSYFEDAGDTLKAQWQQMQHDWEAQLKKMHKQGEEMREAALKAAGGADGKGFADWAEAYAAQMASFAQKMQAEAANAIAAATEARAKSSNKKT